MVQRRTTALNSRQLTPNSNEAANTNTLIAKQQHYCHYHRLAASTEEALATHSGRAAPLPPPPRHERRTGRVVFVPARRATADGESGAPVTWSAPVAARRGAHGALGDAPPRRRPAAACENGQRRRRRPILIETATSIHEAAEQIPGDVSAGRAAGRRTPADGDDTAGCRPSGPDRHRPLSGTAPCARDGTGRN